MVVRPSDRNKMSVLVSKHYGQKVIIPRRIKADFVDGFIGVAICGLLLIVGELLPDKFMESTAWVSAIGVPLSFFYVLFRDAIGNGTSAGKRALGLVVIELNSGQPSSSVRVWSRNLIDILPIINLIDFIASCMDAHGQKIMDKILNTQVVEGNSSVGTAV